jgi:phage terminase large subunit GpA-like protein
MSAGFQLVPEIGPEVLAAFEQAAEVLKPPPRLTLTEWAERNIVLSSEDSAYGGQPYRTRVAPYQRGMQDALLDRNVRRVVYMTSAQIGKTQIFKNAIAYFMREDPSPMLFMLPTIDLAQKVSEQRIAPMLRDCPALRGLVTEGGRRRGNSTLAKTFPGGALYMIGANSPASISSMPMRIFFSDEVDRNPSSAGEEGDPVNLGEKRQTTFWNALTLLASTPTIKGESRIEGAYDISDRGKYWVPCPHCGESQVLKWKRLVFPKHEDPTIENTVYACEHCGVALTEFDKPEMLERGEWRSDRPEIRDIRGFWINELYSPFTKWYEMARTFKEAMRKRENPQLLKTFVNLSLAETWEDESEKIDGDELLQRREEYPPPALPDGVTVLTCGVDVQEDRLELEVVGHGKGEETWSVDRKRFEGNTSRLKGVPREDGSPDPSPWEQLETFLRESRYLHERGVRLAIAATLVDSGDQTSIVYQFTKAMQKKGVRCFASKGVGGWARTPVSNWNRNNKQRVKLYPLGVDTLKKLVYDRLAIAEVGAGYCHFSTVINDDDYFRQLTAEKIVKVYLRGYPTKQWQLKSKGIRNEALDCRVYATAALYTLHSDTTKLLDQLRKSLLARAKHADAARRAGVLEGQLPLLPLPDAADERPEDQEESAQAPAADGSDQQIEEEQPAETPAIATAAAPPAPKLPDLPTKRRKRFVVRGWV